MLMIDLLVLKGKKTYIAVIMQFLSNIFTNNRLVTSTMAEARIINKKPNKWLNQDTNKHTPSKANQASYHT